MLRPSPQLCESKSSYIYLGSILAQASVKEMCCKGRLTLNLYRIFYVELIYADWECLGLSVWVNAMPTIPTCKMVDNTYIHEPVVPIFLTRDI